MYRSELSSSKSIILSLLLSALMGVAPSMVEVKAGVVVAEVGTIVVKEL